MNIKRADAVSGQNQHELTQSVIEAMALGDALGASTEFASINNAVDFVMGHQTMGFPFTPVGGGWLHLKPGEHTDDTDMALAIVRGMSANGQVLDYLAVAGQFANWVASAPPDVGASIRSVVSSPSFRADPLAVSRAFFFCNPQRCANGALMRNGIIAALAPDLATGLEWSLKQGILTHYAPLSVLCCSIQTWLTHEMLYERQGVEFLGDKQWLGHWERCWLAWINRCQDPIVQQWYADVRNLDQFDEAFSLLRETDRFNPEKFNPFTETELSTKQGWALLSLQIAVWTAQWALRPKAEFPFPDLPMLASVRYIFEKREHAVIGWIPLIGHDCDTYGAIAGPLIVAALDKPFPDEMTTALAIRRAV